MHDLALTILFQHRWGSISSFLVSRTQFLHRDKSFGRGMFWCRPSVKIKLRSNRALLSCRVQVITIAASERYNNINFGYFRLYNKLSYARILIGSHL